MSSAVRRSTLGRRRRDSLAESTEHPWRNAAAAPPAVVADVEPAKKPAAGKDEGVVDPAAAAQARLQMEKSGLELTGVVFGSGSRLAHINGKILGEGAQIKGYRLVKIARESVLLEKDGTRYILRLKR